MLKLDRNEYDTLGGIVRSLKHYPHFHSLLEARRKAYQERDEHLNSFIVLKAFTLDEFGQLGKLYPSPREALKDLPEVVEMHDFYEYLKGTSFASTGLSNVLSPVYLPPLNIKCPACDKYYGVEDCYDVSISHKNEIHFNLSDFVGKQLWEVRRYLQNDHGVHRFIHPNLLIHNNRFLDERIKPYFNSTSPINSHGWVGVEDGITDAYVIQPGDATEFSEIRYFHKQCFVPWKTEESRIKFEEVLNNAGLQEFTMVPTLNKYGSFNYHGSWFVVNTHKGNFTIGWRKRVIEITFDNWPINLSELFVAEQITVGRQFVHAYGYEKATSYLQTIFAVMAKKPA